MSNYKNESEIKPFIVKTHSKSELAVEYGVSGKTLKRKVLESGGKWPTGRTLMPKDVSGIVEAIGEPYREFKG
jgi:hypothetical protein